MKDYTKTLPEHMEKYTGENDIFLETFEGKKTGKAMKKRPPLLFVHGAYTGSWMWSKFIPHFVDEGWNCYAMNLRSHYKSRVMDMTKGSFEDYLDDIRVVVEECGEAPVLIGFSMGGILCQKLAETAALAGLVLIDTSISREVNAVAPYKETEALESEIILPAPLREERASLDESEDDIAFQKKYLSMESSRAIRACACWISEPEGISIDSSMIDCPCLVIKAINNEDDDKRGRTTAQHLSAEYAGLSNMTHTGLLVGQRYMETVNKILEWL